MVSINELAHIKPLTAVGRELIRRGHRVTFAAPESWCVQRRLSTVCMYV